MVLNLKKHLSIRMPSQFFFADKKSEARERLILDHDPDYDDLRTKPQSERRSERGIDGELMSRGMVQFLEDAAIKVPSNSQNTLGVPNPLTDGSQPAQATVHTTPCSGPLRRCGSDGSSSSHIRVSSSSSVISPDSTSVSSLTRPRCDIHCSCGSCDFVTVKKSRTYNLNSGGEVLVNGYDLNGSSRFLAAARLNTDPETQVTVVFEDPRPIPETRQVRVTVLVDTRPSEYRNQVYKFNLSQLKESGWYYDNINYKQAQALLQHTQPGTFLLRASSEKNYMFSLSVQTTRGPTSVRVNWIKGKFQLDAEEKYDTVLPKHDTIIGLLEHHVQTARNGGQVWVEPNGELYSRVVLTKPLKRNVPTLKHMCRVLLNRNPGRDIIPPGIQTYMHKYPYRL